MMYYYEMKYYIGSTTTNSLFVISEDKDIYWKFVSENEYTNYLPRNTVDRFIKIYECKQVNVKYFKLHNQPIKIK